MNKALHVLVYLFLILSAASLWFEMELNKKRELLTDRNGLQEEYFIKIASTIEKADPNKDAVAEVKKDVSPVEAKLIDIPDMENVLEEYNAYLEQDNLETFSWDNMSTKEQLRTVYVVDHEGKVVMDGIKPLMKGNGTEDALLSQLFDASKKMQAKLNTTRAELVKLHGIVNEQVAEINKLKPEARQDKVTIVEKTETIAKLEEAKADLENQVVKIKTQIDELNAEITSLRDEVSTAQDETEAAKEELQKSQKLVDQLKNLIQKMMADASRRTGEKNDMTTLPAGEKGTVVEVDNENMFVIVEFTDESMKELKGENLDRPVPIIELGIKRAGFKGQAGEFVGNIRLRQEVREKKFVICDIIGSWRQDDIKIGDTVFAY